jgi:menaquinone-dependent protoporphyrinogen oxidase
MVDCVEPGGVRGIDGYDVVDIGSAVYIGRWLKPAKAFVHRFDRESDAVTEWADEILVGAETWT